MKTIISIFFVLFVSLTATIYPTLDAAALTSQNISVFHPNYSKTVAVGREIFTYQTFNTYKPFNSNTSQVISKTEITQPSEYGGLLLRKHVLQVPEEIYIIKGNFEFAFSEPEQKTKVSQGEIVSIPSGVPFGFRHIGKGEGKVVVVSRSDALPRMLSEVGYLLKDESEITSRTSELDINKIVSAAKKNGIEFLN
ncbi:MAG: cupin domain-containing protein [Cyanobacteriota bacterium]|nr:cupin domain-containing protein [Cyanobacteriota bacterium]